jgi:AIPR protein/abortive infection phage resistance-like protein
VTQPNLADFVNQLDQRVQDRMADDTDMMARDAFVALAGEYLVEDGTFDDLTTCFIHAPWGNRRIEVAGYDLTGDDTILHLVIADYEAFGVEVKRDRLDPLVRRAAAFAEFCHAGLHEQLERSSPAYDMAEHIHARWSTLQMVRIFVLTNGVASFRKLRELQIAGLQTAVHVWDLARLQRLMGVGAQQEEIVIDLTGLGYTVPCLESPPQADGYRCLLTVLPGQLLADLYDEHHSRLLQRNVRAFLQARGKVNKGIAETIQKEPGRFLAYNNGVSATAKAAGLESGPNGTVLHSLTELQIVNGGQTTASLHHAARRGLSLSEVHVPAKITLMDDERLDPMVSDISKYANSQNAVTAADFEGNSVFHVGLERLSRTIWAPADSTGQQTRWYYERVRGQYDVDRNRHQAAPRRREFDRDNPKSQRFSKTDAARFEYASTLRPHVVCLGGEKCFRTWTQDEELHSREAPDATYFRHLVAKAIVFSRIRKVIQRENFGGYLGQTAAYTVALLNERLGGLDLDRIWRVQRLPDELEDVVLEVATVVRKVLVAPPDSANVTEWCKKPGCWTSVQATSWTPPESARLVAAPG